MCISIHSSDISPRIRRFSFESINIPARSFGSNLKKNQKEMHACIQCCHHKKASQAPSLPAREALAMSPHSPLFAVFPTSDSEGVSNQVWDRRPSYSDCSPTVVFISIIIIIAFGVWYRLSTDICWNDNGSASTSWKSGESGSRIALRSTVSLPNQ